MAWYPDHRGARRHFLHHHRVGGDRRSRTDADSSEHLRAGANVDVPLDGRSADVSRTEADGDEGTDHDTGADLNDAVDHHLAVQQMHARMDDDGIADRDPGAHDGQPMEDSGEHRDAASLERGLDSI